MAKAPPRPAEETMICLTAEQADRFFASLSAQTPDQIRRALAYVESNWRDGNKSLLFAYDTDHNHAWYLLGLAYEKLGQRRDAAQCFLTAAKIWPDDSDAYIAYSNTEDDLAKQIPVLKDALARLHDPRIKHNLSNAYRAGKRR